MEPEIRLYSQKINPYAEKVARALNFKGLHYERVVSDDPGDLQRWSPVTHKLPVLEYRGRRIWESATILRFLEEQFPEPPLLSPDPKTAAAQERFAEWSDTSFVWYWNRWREARFPRPGDERPAATSALQRLSGFVQHLLGRPAVEYSRGQLREIEVAEELANRLDDLVGLLGDRPFFHSDSLSVADLSVYGMLQAMRDSPMIGGATTLGDRPSLVAYMERVEDLTRLCRAPDPT